MKKLLVIILSSLLLLTMVSCSATSPTTYDSQSETASTTTYAGYNDGDYASEDGKGGSTVPDGQSVVRQIIKNAYISLEAKDVEAAYNDLLAYAATYGGYEVDKNQWLSDEKIMIDARIKIAPDHLDAFLAYAGDQYHLVSSQVSTEDITASYYDLKTRLDTKEKSLVTYYNFLDNAANIEESLQVQSEINRLTEEIESLKGQLALWDSLLAESAVTISLRQLSDPIQEKREINWSTLTFDDMAYLMKAGIATLTNAIVVFLQWVAIVLVVISPLWIIGLIVLFVVLRIRRKRRIKKASEEIQAPEDDNAAKY